MAARAVWAGLVGAAMLAATLSGCGGQDDEERADEHGANVQAEAPNAAAANVTAPKPANAIDPAEAARRAEALKAHRTTLSEQEEALSTAPAPYEGDSSAATALPPQTDDAPPAPVQPNGTGPRA